VNITISPEMPIHYFVMGPQTGLAVAQNGQKSNSFKLLLGKEQKI